MMAPLSQPSETVKLSLALQRLKGKCLLPHETISAICSLAHDDGSGVGILFFGRLIKHGLELPLSTYIFLLQCSSRLYTLLLFKISAKQVCCPFYLDRYR